MANWAFKASRTLARLPSANHSTALPAWGAICMIASLIFFTVNALLLKHLSSNAGVSPWISLAVRALVGLLVVKLFFAGDGKVDFRRATTNPLLVCRGLFGVLGSLAYYFTIPTLGAGKATLISNTYVVIAAVLAAWYLKERLTISKLLGNALACMGLVLLLGLTPSELTRIGPNECLAVFGAIMAAATVVVIRQLTQTESSAMIYTTQCLYILLASLPAAIYYWSTPTNEQIVLLLVSGLCATFGQLAMTDGFRHLTVAVGGAFQIFAPVLISLGSVLFFDESFSIVQVLGGAMILVGCYWVVAIRAKPSIETI